MINTIKSFIINIKASFSHLTADDVATGIGSGLGTFLGIITMDESAKVLFFAVLGGFGGIFAKKSGELIWNIGLEKVKKIFNKNNMNE